MTKYVHPLFSLLLTFSIAACSQTSESEERPITRDDLAGVWRVVLDSPGGELPFTIEIFDQATDGPPAIVQNGEERAPFSQVTISNRRVNLRIDHLDTALTGMLDADRETLVGTWQAASDQGTTTLPIRAFKGQTHRFDARPKRADDSAGAVPSVAGTWRVELDRDPDFVGIADFRQDGDRVTGTVLYADGTFRYLDGDYRDGVLRLSTFNGAIAVLIRGFARPDGTLVGEIWVDDQGFRVFKAAPVTDDDPLGALPDPSEIVTVKSPDRQLHFAYPDTEGNTVSIDDVRFEDKVVLVELFGTWCSNCNDAAPHMQDWYARYHDRGLEIVGLAFEHTGDQDRDRRQVRAYKKHYGIEFPLLVAGTTHFTEEPLPELTMSPAFPTMVFIKRDGTIHTVLNGFIGPSAGRYYEERLAHMESILETLLDE